jgi:hypothetical protein
VKPSALRTPLERRVRVGEQRGRVVCVMHSACDAPWIPQAPVFSQKKVGFFILTLRGGLVAWG